MCPCAWRAPRILEKNQCVLVRRDTREKVFVSLDELETAIPAQLEALRQDLYQRALKNREARTWAATTMEEVKQLAQANTGYIKTMWCGDLACEMKMKEEAGLSSRCMPFAQEHLSDVCPCCGKPAKTMVYWGVAYSDPPLLCIKTKQPCGIPKGAAGLFILFYMSVTFRAGDTRPPPPARTAGKAPAPPQPPRPQPW